MVQRNAEACCNIKKLEEKLAGLESQLFCIQKDNECTRKCNCDLQNCLAEKLKERDALTAHVACLTNQNAELSKELSHFVQ